MTEHNVDLLIRVRDEATKKLGLFADNMTAMQQKITNSIGSRQAGMGGDQTAALQKQFEARFELEDRLYRATHDFQQIALRDTDEYFAQLRVKWQHNQQMLTLIEKTAAAERKRIMEQSAPSGKSQMQQFMGTFTGKGTAVGIGLMASAKVMDGITGAIQRYKESDKTGLDLFNTIAESIPLFGRAARAARELGTELSGVREAQAMAARATDVSNKVMEMSKGYARRAEMRNAPDDMERQRLQAKYDYEDQLDKIEALKAENKLIEKYNAEQRKKGEEGIALHNVSGLDKRAQKDYAESLKEINTRPIKDVTSSLQEQINTFGMTAGEIGYYKAQLAGATQEELAQIQAMDANLTALEEGKKKEQEAADARKTIKDTTASLKQQAETYGMNAGQIAYYKAQLAGATQEELANIKAMGEKLQTLDEQAEKQKTIDDVTASLKEQVETYGMNAGEIAYYKAQLAGATQEELAQIQALSEKLKLLEDEKTKQKEAEQEQKKQEREMQSFTERVKKMIQTPAQEFAEVQKQLDEALKKGMLTQEEYYTARNKFAKEIFDSKPKSKASDRSMAWSPFESRLMTTAPAGRNPTIDAINTSNKFLKDIAKNTQRPKITPTTSIEQILEL